MRKLQVLSQLDLVAAAHAPGGRAPFANAIQGEDGGLGKGAGKERARRMTFVMIRKQEPTLELPIHAVSDIAAREQLVLEPNRQSHAKTAPPAGGKSQIRFQQALKFR